LSTILPLSSYPTRLDSDTTLFRVFDTAETSLSSALLAWSTKIEIVPTELNSSQIWAENGYITIEGELIYYAGVTRSSGAVVSFDNCIRRVNGTPSRNFSAGTAVRGYVIAEHHNNLARAITNIETFIGTNDTQDKNSIYWKLNYINNLVPYTDDAGCPQVEFYYKITSESPIQGTEITYTLNISTSDVYTGFVIDFGDGSTETQITNGTHFYPPNKKIDPTVTVTSTTCDTLQTTAQRVELGDLQQTNLIGSATFPVVVPALPDFPVFDLAIVNPVQENIVFPPIVFPCLDLGNLGSIVVPSTISFVGAVPIPSVITFENVPTIPSQIVITSTANIPSSIVIIDDIPTSINVIDNIPSVIDINANLPSVISIIAPSNMSISLIAPSVINISPSVIKINSNIPSVISISNADIAISLTSDYCTNCTGSLQSSAPNTVGGTTDQGCNVCAGANQKITKVSVVLHDFFVQTFGASTPYSRYDLVKVLVVDPNGNTCLVMGGATAVATSTPQYVMNDAVTLTFEDGSPNNIYDFSKPLKTGTYAPNANGNTTFASAGQVTLHSPAPPPVGYNGYGSTLSVFTDQPLTAGAWNVYIGVGPESGFSNLVYVSAACVRVNSTGEGPCDFPTPTPSPCGATPKPTKTPAATPRQTNPPIGTPANTPNSTTPAATPNSTTPAATPNSTTPAATPNATTPIPSPTPTPTVTPAALNYYLYTWGWNFFGQIGNNTRDLDGGVSRPVFISPGSSNWAKISSGWQLNQGIKANGTLWSWGRNSEGELANNDEFAKSTPVQEITFSTNWIDCSCVGNVAGGIKADNTLWLWGDNYAGGLCQNKNYATLPESSSPLQIYGGGSWKKIVVQSNYGAGGMKTDNTLWFWGSNFFGECGADTDNTSFAQYSSPVQEITLSTSWQDFDMGNSFTAALKNDGSLWLWGDNYAGQLGDGTANERSSPVQEITNSSWKMASTGLNFTLAIKYDNTLWSWGANYDGQLGQNSNVSILLTPTQVGTDNNWAFVSAGDVVSLAIKSDGSLWSWGLNDEGQLAQNNIISYSSPTYVADTGDDWIWGGGMGAGLKLSPINTGTPIPSPSPTPTPTPTPT